MTSFLIDTNVLLDVIGSDIHFGESSRIALEDCARKGTLVINPIIYAEVGAHIDSLEELDSLLPKHLFRRDELPWTASWLAGQAYHAYRQRGGSRNRVLADFLIGAHAASTGMTLLSRDKGYNKHFQLSLINPTPEQ